MPFKESVSIPVRIPSLVCMWTASNISSGPSASQSKYDGLLTLTNDVIHRHFWRDVRFFAHWQILAQSLLLAAQSFYPQKCRYADTLLPSPVWFSIWTTELQEFGYQPPRPWSRIIFKGSFFDYESGCSKLGASPLPTLSVAKFEYSIPNILPPTFPLISFWLQTILMASHISSTYPGGY